MAGLELEEFSFQQKFGERFLRAIVKAIPGPTLGLRDTLRAAGKSLIAAFIGGGIHMLTVWVMKS